MTSTRDEVLTELMGEPGWRIVLSTVEEQTRRLRKQLFNATDAQTMMSYNKALSETRMLLVQIYNRAGQQLPPAIQALFE